MSMIEDAEDIGLRVAYHHFLNDRSNPPLSFEGWMEKRRSLSTAAAIAPLPNPAMSGATEAFLGASLPTREEAQKRFGLPVFVGHVRLQLGSRGSAHGQHWHELPSNRGVAA